MKQKLNGIALILFAILLYMSSSEIQDCLWRNWGFGVTIPWFLITLIMGIVGLILTLKKQNDN